MLKIIINRSLGVTSEQICEQCNPATNCCAHIILLSPRVSAENRQSLGPYARVWSRPVLTVYGPFLSRIASFLPSLPTIWCQFRPSAPSEQQLLRCISFNYSCWNKHSNFHRFLGGKLLRQHRLVWWDWFPRAIRRIYCPLPSRALTFNQIEDYFSQEKRSPAKSGNVFGPAIILGQSVWRPREVIFSKAMTNSFQISIAKCIFPKCIRPTHILFFARFWCTISKPQYLGCELWNEMTNTRYFMGLILFFHRNIL